MAKKILIVSSSLRSGSNSEILAHEDEKKGSISGSTAGARELNLIIFRINKRLPRFLRKNIQFLKIQLIY